MSKGKKDFEDFLVGKKNQRVVNWAARKKKWNKALNELYSNIQNWIKPYSTKGLIRISKRKIILNEDYIGQYNVEQLELFLGADKISFIPRGTLIVGSFGRVDVKGPKGENLLILKKWDEWNFATRFPTIQYLPFNQDSLFDVIKEIAG